MRAAEYTVPATTAGGPATLTVFYFGEGQGASIEANLDRWLGEVRQPDGRTSRDAARIETRDVRGIRITVVDVTGIHGGMSPSGEAAPDRPNHRLLGAIAVGPRGPVFFKLTGPVETVASADASFMELLDSLHPI